MAEQASTGRNLPFSQKKQPSQLQSLQNDVNNLFRGFFGGSTPQTWPWQDDDMMQMGTIPATDVVETDKDYRIMTELPGMDVKDVTITLNEGNVVIKGEKKEESKEDRNGYFRQERSFGQFQRVVALPPNMADEDKAEATMTKGILTVTIPKKSEAQSKARKLDIRGS